MNIPTSKIRRALALRLTGLALATITLSLLTASSAQAFFWTPDLRVTAFTPWDGATDTYFKFQIENIGAADSGSVALKGVCKGSYPDPAHPWGPKTVYSSTIAAGLKSGQKITVGYWCKGGNSGWVQSTMTATTADDGDLSNNSRTIDND